MQLSQPQSSDDFARYFQLRWEILRAPWGQEKGSEQDELDAQAFHIMAVVGTQIVGVGRLHASDASTGQIRYMAVRQDTQGLGIGRHILNALEDQAVKNHFSEIRLNARNSAVGFYEEHGYQCLAEGHTLYNEIKHTLMQKTL